MGTVPARVSQVCAMSSACPRQEDNGLRPLSLSFSAGGSSAHPGVQIYEYLKDM